MKLPTLALSCFPTQSPAFVACDETVVQIHRFIDLYATYIPPPSSAVLFVRVRCAKVFVPRLNRDSPPPSPSLELPVSVLLTTLSSP